MSVNILYFFLKNLFLLLLHFLSPSTWIPSKANEPKFLIKQWRLSVHQFNLFTDFFHFSTFPNRAAYNVLKRRGKRRVAHAISSSSTGWHSVQKSCEFWITRSNYCHNYYILLIYYDLGFFFFKNGIFKSNVLFHRLLLLCVDPFKNANFNCRIW